MTYTKRLYGASANELQRMLPMDRPDSMKRKITLIYTGGTIGVSGKIRGDILKSEGTGEVLHQILLDEHPEIKDDYDLSFKRHISLLSENIVPYDWEKIANSIAVEIDEGVDGIVVAHGTDSLPYTTAAVSFMLSDIPIPVVFTGSLVPPDRKGTDAIQNLYDSISFSAKSQLAGVYAVFKGKDNSRKVFLGTRLLSIPPYSKYFHSIGHRYVGKIENGDIHIFNNRYPKRYKPMEKIARNTKIDPNVSFFKVFPGFDPGCIEQAFEHGAKGIILDLFHSGTACTRNGKYSNYSLIPTIKRLGKNVLIFGTHLPESKEGGIYSTTNDLLKSGLIPLKLMSSESAIVKLMWVLGHQKKREQIIKEMNNDIAGEIVSNKW